MNYLSVSSLRWAPASAQQWFRHFHHHGRGDRHIWGWPVRGAGMYDGQILSQLMLRQKRDSLRERKTRAGRSDPVGPPWRDSPHVRPLEDVTPQKQMSNTTQQHKNTQLCLYCVCGHVARSFSSSHTSPFCLVWLPCWPDSQAQLSHYGGPTLPFHHPHT